MCTVLLRLAPGARWPLLVAAVRDEFTDRAWDPPAAHWPGRTGHLLGGRDRVSGGTWLAVDPDAPALAALLNGVRLPRPADGARPTRGALPLAALAGGELPADLSRHDGFHLLHATPAGATVATWDGASLTRQALAPGDHILVNDGVDAVGDPLVPHFAPLLAAAGTPPLAPGTDTAEAWGDWVTLLRGDDLPPADPRALLVGLEVLGRRYGSSSASLVALGPHGARYDFAAFAAAAGGPGPARWRPVWTATRPAPHSA